MTNWQARFFSGVTYAFWLASAPLIERHCRGKALDAGGGRGGWREVILRYADVRECIDIDPREDDGESRQGDICDMPQVPTGGFDTVVCHQVLEHVRRPVTALEEMRRVAKEGGHLVISVPHLSRRHDLPSDYWRFTQEGLSLLLEETGWSVVEVRPYGGIFCFCHHQVSSVILPLADVIPLVGTVAAAINLPFTLFSVLLDRITDPFHFAPAGVAAAALKPNKKAG